MPSPSTTASSPDSPPSQAVPPPSNSSSNSSSPPSSSPSPPSPSSSPSPPLQSSPPPEKSQPAPPPPQSPPPSKGSSPPPSNGSPPPPSNGSPPPPSNGSPPPPSSSDASPPPPPDNSSGSSPPQTVSPPPPPHSSGRSPPPPPHKVSPSSVSDNSSSSSSGSNNSLPLIVGVTVGVGLLLIAMILICRSCFRKKKRKPGLMEMQYYGDPSQNGGGYYTNPTQPSWHHSPQGMNHVVRLSTPPGGPVGPPAGGAWPSPPPPMMMPTSGEMSSSFSGPYKPPLPPPSPNISLGFNKSTFSFEELAAATSGFSQANLLGQGGFGYVHKGVFPNGQEVAVKSLKSGSGQGEREFQAEVEIISRVHHRHLVSLVGYCIADGQRMLVYEFVSNKTLEYHLHGNGRPTMDWSTRLRIGVGSSKGLAYLHEDCHPRIIHRDIKAANILLDDNFEAMVADFGLAKLSSDNYTHVSTRVMGTFGYLAPEYASSGKLTEKSDVFSYGVMLLELITGKRPVDPSSTMDDSLVDWARPLLARALEEGEYDELVDPKLENNYNPNEMARMVACAAASIRHSARRRPKMSQIARALEGDTSLLEDLKDGVKPGQSSVFSSNGSSEYDTAAYNTDMKKFRKMALMSSQEFASSESSNEFREGNGTNQKNYL